MATPCGFKSRPGHPPELVLRSLETSSREGPTRSVHRRRSVVHPLKCFCSTSAVVIAIDFARCMTRWANSAGRGFEDIASRFGFDAAYEEHERGTLDVAGYFEALRRGLSVDLADDELLEGWNDIYVGVNEEICPVLAAARARFPLYALTTATRVTTPSGPNASPTYLRSSPQHSFLRTSDTESPIGRHSTPSPR